MKGLLNLVLYSNFFVAICAAGLVFASELLLYGTMDWRAGSFVFASCLFSYNIQRLIRYGPMHRELTSDRVLWFLRRRKGIQLLTVVSGGITVVFYFLLATPEAQFCAIFLGLIAMGYAIRFIPGKPRKNLRDIPGLKIFLIGLTWAGAGVLIPALNREGIVAFDTLYVSQLFLERFLFIVAITIPFDIRDLRYDGPDKRTIPQITGAARARIVAIVILFCCIALVWYGYVCGNYSFPILGSYFLTVLIAAVLVAYSSEKRGEFYYAGWLDGTMLLHFGLIARAVL